MNIYETIKAAVSVKQGRRTLRAESEPQRYGLLPVPQRQASELEAERGIFLLLRLRSQGGCNRLRGKVV